MTDRARYMPGPAAGARVEKAGDRWTLVLVRDLHHPPERVWDALTDPVQLQEWAPFDADASLAHPGAKVKLTTIGAPAPYATAETIVKRAEAPRVLEYTWSGNEMRWVLEPQGSGTRLTLWHNIDRGYIAWGAAGWHICFDVMNQFIDGQPLGRMVGPEVMKFRGWQELRRAYADQFGVEADPAPRKENQ